MTLAFLDTETTGLDLEHHDAWEVAYALGDGPITTYGLPHGDPADADPLALEVGRYHQRVHRLPPIIGIHDRLRAELAGVTLVGANPGFDAGMLHKQLGCAPWHYRMVDVSTGVMWLAGWDKPRGLLGSTYELRHRGHRIPMPDHTAGGDVATVRAIYRVLRRELPRLR